MAHPIGMKAFFISLVSPYSVENGARPIAVKSDLKTESVENGATYRNAGVFKVYSLLKLALSLSFSLKCKKF